MEAVVAEEVFRERADTAPADAVDAFVGLRRGGEEAVAKTGVAEGAVDGAS